MFKDIADDRLSAIIADYEDSMHSRRYINRNIVWLKFE